MGAFLEKPKTDKSMSTGKGSGLEWGVSAMQGWRMEMEDSHTCETDLKLLPKSSFFAVFDGHAGAKVSQYCSENLLDEIMCNLKAEGDFKGALDSEKIKKAIYDGFLGIDVKLLENPLWKEGKDRGGTTAVCCMVSPDKLIWANCGDSRGLLCRDGKLEYNTVDHKPVNDVEKARIEKAGGTVMMQRVNGSLAVSRALGDFDYKRGMDLNPIDQLVSPEPEVCVLDRSEKDEFLLLACDGVFDVMTNEEIVKYILHHLELEKDLSKICSDLIDMCLNKNSRDNMSVILIRFPNAPKVSEEAIEKAKKTKEEQQRAIVKKLQETTAEAHDPMDLEENYIFQQVVTELSPQYSSELYNERPFVVEQIQTMKVAKFGKDTTSSYNFTGPSDPSQAPPDFQQGPISDPPFGTEYTAVDTDSKHPETPMEGVASSPSNTDSTTQEPDPRPEAQT